MAKKAKGPRSGGEHAEIGRRLLWSRLALGKETHSDFIAGTDIKRNSYSEWETGERRISLDGALALCNRHELSLDWIYFGRLATIDDPLLRDRIRDERSKSLSRRT